MSGLLINEPFVAVFPSLVRHLNSIESAAILQYMHFRADEEGAIRLTQQEISDATGIGYRTVERRVKIMRDEGILRGERSASYDATLTYWINHDRLVSEGSTDTIPAYAGVEIDNLADSAPPFRQSGGLEPAKLADSSTKNERTTSTVPTSGGMEVEPERHPSRAITHDWVPRREVYNYLAWRFPHIDTEGELLGFVAYRFSKQQTSKSWEADLISWFTRKDSERKEELRAGTDDLGNPHGQHKSTVVGDGAKPGDPDYFDSAAYGREIAARKRPPVYSVKEAEDE